MTPLTKRMFVHITEVQRINRREEPCIEEEKEEEEEEEEEEKEEKEEGGESYDDRLLKVWPTFIICVFFLQVQKDNDAEKIVLSLCHCGHSQVYKAD